MRNLFRYDGFNKDKLLKGLLNLSIDVEYISVLLSNRDINKSELPKDYINYDLLAGVGMNDILVSNHDSFRKLNSFHCQKEDWLFGYLSYDLKNEIEELSSDNIDNFNADNLFFFIPEYVLVLNNNQLEIQTYHSKDSCDEFVKAFNFSDIPFNSLEINLNRRENKSSYLRKVKKVKEHIQKGDIYEMNYCQEFYANGIELSPQAVFLELNGQMQTPFSSFLRVNDQYVLSASPERFLRKESTYILSQPIKGTKKRGADIIEDNYLINKLKISQKDISENVMITDLVRNDLSIVAKKKSVKVEEFCKVYTFKKVHQMITSISAEVETEINFADVLKAAFPMGSMTGAPKLKAMELIEDLEETKRGVFSGAVGYVTPNADFDFNVVIRTILYNLADNYLSIGVGGAITIKSDPLDEYEECLIKAGPLFNVLNFKIDD